MKRSLLREHIFVLVFMTEFNFPEEMPEKVRLYMESLEKPADDASREEIEGKFKKIQSNIPEIDSIIEAHSDKWTVQRMGKVELSILRLAVCSVVPNESPKNCHRKQTDD